jgi:CubicO group peptidase (beta-lactamase class C family)
MKVLRNAVLLVPALLLAACESEADSVLNSDENVSLCAEKVSPILQEDVDNGIRSGFVATIATGDGVLCQSAVGMADPYQGVSMAEDTRFRIASMTKPIISVAAMQLVERGVIRLGDPVSRFIPSFGGPQVAVRQNKNGDGGYETRPAAREITIHDLLRHMTGVGYAFAGETDLDKDYLSINLLAEDLTLPEIVDDLAALPLYEDPGTQWRYSYATDILGRVVEVASGQTLEEYLTENIFTPLGMTDTAFFMDEDDFERLAIVSEFNDAGVLVRSEGNALGVNVNDKPFGVMSGGAGLLSSAHDYARFSMMLLNDGQLDGARVLSPATVRLMMSDHMPFEARPDNWKADGHSFGLGGIVVLEPGYTGNVSAEGEWGWGGYWDTWFVVNKRDDIAVVLLAQAQPNQYLKPSRARDRIKAIAYSELTK